MTKTVKSVFLFLKEHDRRYFMWWVWKEIEALNRGDSKAFNRA